MLGTDRRRDRSLMLHGGGSMQVHGNRRTHSIVGDTDMTMAASNVQIIVRRRLKRRAAMIATPQALWKSTIMNPVVPGSACLCVVRESLPAGIRIAFRGGLCTGPWWKLIIKNVH